MSKDTEGIVLGGIFVVGVAFGLLYASHTKGSTSATTSTSP